MTRAVGHPLPGHHPPCPDHEPHGPPVRRDHGRARRQPAGLGDPGRSRKRSRRSRRFAQRLRRALKSPRDIMRGGIFHNQYQLLVTALSFLTPYRGQPYGPPAFDAPRRPVLRGFSDIWETVLTAPGPRQAARSGQAARRRPDAASRRDASARRRRQSGIAVRFATELVAALVVGGGLGWGIDWLFGHFGFHTRPVFLIVFFMLGAAAGIRNVMRAANEINAEIAATRSGRRRRGEVVRGPEPDGAVRHQAAIAEPLLHIARPSDLFHQPGAADGHRGRVAVVAVPDPGGRSRTAWCRRAASRWPRCPTNSSPT